MGCSGFTLQKKLAGMSKSGAHAWVVMVLAAVDVSCIIENFLSS